MERINLFTDIYKKCNSSNNLDKMLSICEGEREPRYIDVEITNCCNLSCYMCPVGTKSMKRQNGFMSLSLIDKLCSELKMSSVQGVRLIRWGEPTIHKDFIEILKRLKNTGKAVHFNTNGIHLTKNMIESIVDLEVDSIKFSFQGVDKESYEEMRNGSSWDVLLQNIIMLNAIRTERTKPYIQISTTVTYETADQIEKFQRFVAPFCDYCNVGRTKLSHLNIEKMRIDEKQKNKYLSLLHQESLEKKHLSVCPEVFDKLSVNWDGSVSACCSDYDNLLIIGNINENSLKDIFNGKKMNEIRKLICEERYNDIELCKDCFEYIKLLKSEHQKREESDEKIKV